MDEIYDINQVYNAVFWFKTKAPGIPTLRPDIVNVTPRSRHSHADGRVPSGLIHLQGRLDTWFLYQLDSA